MKNPFVKMFRWHAGYTLICIIPFFLYGEMGLLFGLLGGVLGNLALGLYMNICVYENDIKKWTHIQNKEYDEWEDEIDTEYKIRKKELDKLRLKE